MGKIPSLYIIYAFLFFSGAAWGQDNVKYTYDSLNRLIEVHYINKIIRYTYDAAGNRTSEQVINLNPEPILSGLSPEGAVAGGQAFTLTVKGNNFINSSVIQWNGANQVTTFISNSQLTAKITTANLTTAGSAKVTVANPEPGGGVSGALSFKIQTQPNPAPTISSISPDTVVVGAVGLTLVINGTNFVEGSMVRWNGSERVTTFVSATKLTATIPATDLALVGMASVTVYSPSPGGGVSDMKMFSIKPPPNGYEADVSPRVGVNGLVDLSDTLQIGRFVVGLDTAVGSEFQRADCAPRISFGDGRLTIADWVQAGRYAAKFDPLVEGAGPTVPVSANVASQITQALIPEGQPEQARVVRAVNAAIQRGQQAFLRIELDAQGNENALSFTLTFDPKLLSFVDARTGSGASGASLLINTSQALVGRVGIALALPSGKTFAAGTQPTIDLRFIPQGGDGDVTTTVGLNDQVINREVVGVDAASITGTAYTNAIVLITGRALSSVSAASFAGAELAAEGIASAFGEQLAITTATATSTPLPTKLGGTTVKVKDSVGVERSAPLFYVSSTQVNFQVPPGTVPGLATWTITTQNNQVSTGITQITQVAPGLFTVDANGKGLAAGYIQRVRADGSQAIEALGSFDNNLNQFVPLPIDMGLESDQVFLVLYGTGFRHHSGLQNMKVKVGNMDAEVTFAGAQNQFIGLDQVNIRLPRTLIGYGVVEVVLTVDEKTANLVKVSIR